MLKKLLLFIVVVLVYLSGPYIWVRHEYTYAKVSDEISITIINSKNYSLLSRRYIDGPPYKLHFSYLTTSGEMNKFLVKDVNLINHNSRYSKKFDKPKESALDDIYLSSGLPSGKRYGWVTYDIGDLPYEDYLISGTVVDMSGNGKAVELNFNTILKTNYAKEIGWSRLWDSLMGI